MFDRPANRAAKLIPMKGRPRQYRTPIISIEDSVAYVLKSRTVKFIGSGFSEHVDDAARIPAVLCVVTICLNTEFLNRIWVGQDVSRVAQASHVTATVEVIIHRAGTAISTTVNQSALLGKAENK